MGKKDKNIYQKEELKWERVLESNDISKNESMRASNQTSRRTI